MGTSHCSDFSCGAQVLESMGFSRASVVAARGLDSCSPGALEQRLNSCGALASLLCVVCGVFLDQGSNPCLLHWQADSLTLSHQGSPPNLFFKTKVGKCIKIHSLLLKVEDHSCKLVCLVLQWGVWKLAVWWTISGTQGDPCRFVFSFFKADSLPWSLA